MMEPYVYVLIGMAIVITCVLGYKLYKGTKKKPVGYCPKCGAPLMDNGDFCPKCGYRLKEEPEEKKIIEKPVVEESGTDFFIPQTSQAQTEALTESLEDDKPKLDLRININSMLSDIEVCKFPCLVGRQSGDCDILIEEPAVGRRHALIEFENDNYYITDLNSNNGVYINGLKIGKQTRTPIKKDDVIKLGRALITVLDLKKVGE